LIIQGPVVIQKIPFSTVKEIIKFSNKLSKLWREIVDEEVSKLNNNLALEQENYIKNNLDY